MKSQGISFQTKSGHPVHWTMSDNKLLFMTVKEYICQIQQGFSGHVTSGANVSLMSLNAHYKS